MRRFLFTLFALASGTVARAQDAPPPAGTVIAVPPLTSPDSGTKGNQMLQIGWEATQVIVADLGSTNVLAPLKPNRDDYYSYPEVTAPSFGKWRAKGAKALVTGFVQGRSDGRLTFGCYVYDVEKGRELSRKGFVLSPGEWRRAAHKCSSLAYNALAGSPGGFDSQITYVAESGMGEARLSRVAIMDSDGYNHHYVTAGGSLVLSPQISPTADRLAYVSFNGGRPGIRIVDLRSGQEHPLVAGDAITFAPRYSPDGARLAFSMMRGVNSDIYVVAAAGGVPQCLTNSTGADTDASFSPDGRKIVFESDRGGSQQLYVMNVDGSGERRLTFGAGAYASPAWSPDGQWVAFTHRGPEGRRIGVIKADGSAENLLTRGPADESPSWAPSSHELIFSRAGPTGRSALFRVSLEGGGARPVTTPQDGSDPDWSGVLDQ